MSLSQTVAIPSNAPGGLAASPSAHFGHCDAYTVIKVEDGVMSDVQVVPNTGHDHGNCMAPVQILAGMGVNVLIAGGMGMRPLNGLREAGISVYHSGDLFTVKDVFQAFIDGKLQPFGQEDLCKGTCGHHH